MIVIYGTRHYGQVDSHDGEYAVTRFAHVYWLPLFPVGSAWITDGTNDDLRGHKVRISGRSIAAGYARVWGPIATIAAIATGGLGGLVTAGVAAAMTGWSWSWWRLRDARELRRSDYHLLAFGTRCDPLRMPRDLIDALRPSLEQRWSQVSDGRTPDDVARFGGANPAQSVLAYAMLRLAARTAPGEHAAKARDASDRILDALAGTDASSLLEGGPYRSAQIAGDVAPPSR